jgi:replication initiator protein RepSA
MSILTLSCRMGHEPAYARPRLAELPGLAGIGKWVHMLGFRGHFVTKSRGYSTTLGELRQARADYRAQQDDQPTQDDDSILVFGAWTYLGSGYLNPGDVLLAASVEASIRWLAKRCWNCATGHPTMPCEPG